MVGLWVVAERRVGGTQLSYVHPQDHRPQTKGPARCPGAVTCRKTPCRVTGVLRTGGAGSCRRRPTLMR